MRQQGTVIKWKDDKGFGFIQPAEPGPEVFFHARDFRSAAGEVPAPRMRVSFELIQVGGKGPRAMAVRPAGETAVPRAPAVARARREGAMRPGGVPPSSGALFALPLMLAYFVVLLGSVWRDALPIWVLIASFVVNVVTFYLYMRDKFSAAQRAWRTPEKSLHIASLAGGWPAAWFAQQLLRHKSVKAEFRETYWAVVVLHCIAFGAALWLLGLLPPWFG